MSTLFIIGNGFDIAHGIPSRYSDFRQFILEKYPEVEQHRDDIMYCLRDAMQKKDDVLAAELLLHVIDKITGVDWNNFEEALPYITFNEKIVKPNHKENETEEEDNILMQEYLLRISILIGYLINCTEIWNSFFSIWINSLQRKINSRLFIPDQALIKLFSNSDNIFLSFNYTLTLEKLYKIKKVTHIHNHVGQNLLWGHGMENALYDPSIDTNIPQKPFLTASTLDEMINSLKKDSVKAIQNHNHFFKNLSTNINKVYSYGFSFSDVDSIYIKKIINSINPFAIWYFTKFECDDQKSLKIKQTKLRQWGFKGPFGSY